MGSIAITIDIDDTRLPRYGDEHLAALWHIAQANPAPLHDRDAGELAERIGREIIRRWLKATPPELYRHQGSDYYWSELRKLGKWNTDQVFIPNASAEPADAVDVDPAAAGSGAAELEAAASGS